jgi:hypothetical protein
MRRMKKPQVLQGMRMIPQRKLRGLMWGERRNPDLLKRTLPNLPTQVLTLKQKDLPSVPEGTKGMSLWSCWRRSTAVVLCRVSWDPSGSLWSVADKPRLVTTADTARRGRQGPAIPQECTLAFSLQVIVPFRTTGS